MATSKEYIIQFAGLAIGEHLFELNIGNAFFKDFEFSEIKEGNIAVKLLLLKRSNMMVLNFEINGTVRTVCDRCAADFDLPIHGDQKLIVKIGGGEISEEDDDIISVEANEHKLDLKQYLYEYITLSLPIKREHASISDCDKEVISKLNTIIVEEEKEESIDPRWNDLKKIKLN